jgi:hypothetical protein
MLRVVVLAVAFVFLNAYVKSQSGVNPEDVKLFGSQEVLIFL